MLVPLGTAYFLSDASFSAFLKAAVFSLSSGLGLLVFFREASGRIELRGAILVVALVWTSFTLLGALPFYFAGVLPSFVDCWYEASSGFTATGSTVFSEVESLPSGILLWRSLTHFLGGMGVIVLSIAILPMVGVGGMDLYRAESPGPTKDKFTAKVSETARALWIVYMAMTVVAGFTYYFLGMSPFDALNHALSTMAAGGFSTKNESFASFGNPSLEIAASIFMVLSGINFLVHCRLFVRRDEKAIWDPELKFYLTLVLFATVLITFSLLFKSNSLALGEALRLAFFQVSSLISSTGFASADYNFWPPFAQLLLVILMVIGGCAGSPAGGLKCIRAMMLVKQAVRELHQMLHPKAILPLKLGRETVSANIASAIFAHFFLYLLLLVVICLLITASGVDIVTAVTSTISALSNMGPGLNETGPMNNYGGLPGHIKGLLAFVMIVGRLELFTILVLLSRDFWDS